MSLLEFSKGRGSIVLMKVRHWVALGFLVFLASTFFLDGSRQKTIFYILVALPALLLLGRLKGLLRVDLWGVCSVFAFLGYFSLSALWSSGDGSVLTALKFSLYIICLMLAIEAAASRFSVDFIASIIAASAAVAAISYLVAVAVGDASVEYLLAGRFSLAQLAGWGPNNPITSGVIFGLSVISAWWLFPRQRWYVQAMLAVLMLAGLVLMFVSKSRGPFVALALSLLVLIISRRSRADLVLSAGFSLIVVACMLLSNVETVVVERAAVPSYRFEIWLQVLERLRDNWIFGQGFGNDARILIGSGQVVTHSHSFVLEVFRQGGVVGGGLFLLMLVSLLRHSLGRPVGFFLVWLAYGAICLSTNGRMVLSRPSVEWFSFWLPLFLVYFSTRCAVVGQKSESCTREITNL